MSTSYHDRHNPARSRDSLILFIHSTSPLKPEHKYKYCTVTMKGDGIFSNIFMKSRRSKLFKKRTTPSTTRTTATTTPQAAGRAQSVSESTISSVHSSSMTGFAGNLSPPVIIPLHVLMHEDADADNVSLVTQSLVTARGRSSSSCHNDGLFKKQTNGRRRKPSKKCDDEQHKKVTDNRRRRSEQKRTSSSKHSTALPATSSSVQIDRKTQHDDGTTSINITRKDSSNGSAVECMFTNEFVIDTFRSGKSVCSSDSDSNNSDEE